LPSFAASPRKRAASPLIEPERLRSRSAMPPKADAMTSPMRSAVSAAVADVRPPIRSNRLSSERRRRSISPMSSEIARE
jgi:hypothetical protein